MTQPNRHLGHQIKRASTARQRHFCTIASHVPLEDVLGATYWSRFTSAQVREGDIIEFVREDYAFEGTLRVVRAHPSGIAFHIRSLANEDGPMAVPSGAVEKSDIEEDDGRVSVEFAGPAHGWRVKDGKNVAQVNDRKLINLGSKANALKEAAAYREIIAA